MKAKVQLALKWLAFSAILALAYGINKYQILQGPLDWIVSLGVWGPAVFILIYILTCVFFVPSIVFSFAAGVLFGLGKGLVFSLIGAGFGALSAFLIGRYLAHDLVAKAFEHNRNFQMIASALKRKGWKIVILARLTPVFPFLVGNYAFGLTRIDAWHYFLASVIGTIPSTMVYVYIGSMLGDWSALGSMDRARTPFEWALLILGLFATIGLVLYLKRVARIALNQEIPNSS